MNDAETHGENAGKPAKKEGIPAYAIDRGRVVLLASTSSYLSSAPGRPMWGTLGDADIFNAAPPWLTAHGHPQPEPIQRALAGNPIPGHGLVAVDVLIDSDGRRRPDFKERAGYGMSLGLRMILGGDRAQVVQGPPLYMCTRPGLPTWGPIDDADFFDHMGTCMRGGPAAGSIGAFRLGYAPKFHVDGELVRVQRDGPPDSQNWRERTCLSLPADDKIPELKSVYRVIRAWPEYFSSDPGLPTWGSLKNADLFGPAPRAAGYGRAWALPRWNRVDTANWVPVPERLAKLPEHIRRLLAGEAPASCHCHGYALVDVSVDHQGRVELMPKSADEPKVPRQANTKDGRALAIRKGRQAKWTGQPPLYLSDEGYQPFWGPIDDALLFSHDDLAAAQGALLLATRAERQAACQYNHLSDEHVDVVVEVVIDQMGQRAVSARKLPGKSLAPPVADATKTEDEQHAKLYAAFRAQIERDARELAIVAYKSNAYQDATAALSTILNRELGAAAWALTVCELGRASELHLDIVVRLRQAGLVGADTKLSSFGAYALAQLLIENSAIRDREAAK